MWQAFELMHKTFKAGAELYLEGELHDLILFQSTYCPCGQNCGTQSKQEIELIISIDMLPALENFISYGVDTMIQNPPYIHAIVSMVEDIFHDEKVGGMDRIYGCKLAEAIMLNLRGHIDQYIPKFVELAMTVILNDEPKVKSYHIHLMEMVINTIYYNPILGLRVLESNGWTNKFFSSWFSNIGSFTRVHDKKLSIVAISALLTLRVEDVPSSVQQFWPMLLQGVVQLFQTLPAAMKSQYHGQSTWLPKMLTVSDREDVTREDEFTLNEDDEDGEEEEWEGDVEWAVDGDADEGDVKDESAAYLEFLNEEVRCDDLQYDRRV